jgi:hypothetical protein
VWLRPSVCLSRDAEKGRREARAERHEADLKTHALSKALTISDAERQKAVEAVLQERSSRLLAQQVRAS